jgi:hypothetical protein
LEELWKEPRTTRKFSKKSSFLLNNLTIEKQMVLLGYFESATQMRKINAKTEKTEAALNYEALEGSFEYARDWLLIWQRDEKEDLIRNQEMRRALFSSAQSRAIEVLAKRHRAVELLMADEGDFNNFIRKRFRKPAEQICSMTVAINGTPDIPVPGPERGFSRDLEGFQRFRQASVASPLPIPPLKIKKARKSKIGRRRPQSRI